MFIREILSQWTVVDGANTPAFQSLMQPSDSWEDITGTPATNLVPDPNAVIIRHYSSNPNDADYENATNTILSVEEISDAT